MDRWWQLIEETPLGGTPFGSEAVLLAMLLAFVLGQVIAWVYYITHSGLSYSRSYVQSLILITVVIALVMTVIGNNIITAVGLMGALAIVRFRNVLKDTRDIVFIFASLVIGMACGSHRYMTAILGTVILGAIAIYLHFTDFGAHEPHNGFLRFSLRGPIGTDHPVPGILRRFCGNFTLISAQDSGFGGPAEYAYQIMVRNTAMNEEFIAELEKVDGMESINLTMQEKLLEV
ncbi:MAG TPA: DUF4956 domain-containing protein [Sedimentisphaerales bacterium]|nr:DUF4956 domain-containing protein [Sedimentisphaerales bacterium]